LGSRKDKAKTMSEGGKKKNTEVKRREGEKGLL
jgi:hypothetical protein